MRPVFFSLLVITFFASTREVLAQPQVLDDRLHHLRIAGPREWTEFPQKPEAAFLELKFSAKKNATEHALRLRQQDVKQTWNVRLNGKQLGRLHRDENDMVVYYRLPAKGLVEGENTLRIEQNPRGRQVPDDIRVGEIVLYTRTKQAVLGEAVVEVQVTDADGKQPLPARITIVNAKGALQTTGAVSNDHLAVRPGIVFTSTGKASIPLPPGKYTLFAGRGFEYSLDTTQLTLTKGAAERIMFSIRREVSTEGYVACDTHVHTLTHSGHGDASVQERMITIAAEGIELPIATDHNVHIDHDPYARKMHVRKYFTPVIGNEVTTRLGHFNIFPVRAGAKTPDHNLSDWKSIFASIYRTPGVKVVILNHGRDLHGGTRPLGPRLYNAVAGENLEGWRLRANAMEVVNSGATQTDVMQMLHDWMGLLNSGRILTPVGSSDSHDVGRHFVGQGRTYIRCNDADPGNINVDEAVNNFLEGRVMMSYGLLAKLTVDGKYGPGELAPAADAQIKIAVSVLGPHWVKATSVELYANGQKIRQATIASGGKPLPLGVKWTGEWVLTKPKHDVHLVAVAKGPGIDGLYWKTAKAYQPTSPDWEAHVIGCSGAVWLDVDGDGRKTTARDYARRLVDASGNNPAKLIESLAPYDQAVAAQAAFLSQSKGRSVLSKEFQSALREASDATRAGFAAYIRAWRENQKARMNR